MADVSFELSTTLERHVVRGGKNPWKWKGQILLSDLTVADRQKLSLPLNGGSFDIIPMSGVVDPLPDIRLVRKAALDVLRDKAQEIKELIKVPKTETLRLPPNENCKDTLTTLEQLSAKPIT